MLRMIKDTDARKVVGGLAVCESAGNNHPMCSNDGKTHTPGAGIGTGLIPLSNPGTNGPIVGQ